MTQNAQIQNPNPKNVVTWKMAQKTKNT